MRPSFFNKPFKTQSDPVVVEAQTYTFFKNLFYNIFSSYVKVGASGPADGEDIFGHSWRCDVVHRSRNAKLIARLLEAETKVDWLEEIRTLGGCVHVQMGVDSAHVSSKKTVF